MLKPLERLRHGCLELRLPDGSVQRFGRGEPHAHLHLRNWNVFQAALARGDVGLAETYMAGDWTTASLPDLIGLFVRNRQEIERLVYGSWLGRLACRLRHLLNRNSRSGSRRNISAHYDLGNAFYRLWLDETMNYSAAWFDGRPGQSLSQAQDAKVRRALDDGRRGRRAAACWRSAAAGAPWPRWRRATSAPMSPASPCPTSSWPMRSSALGARRRRARTDLRLQDYRDIADAPFDAICSIEMVEAVGREWWPRYFATVARLLKPGGRACIQTIVIDDALWDRYIAGTDFIQQYIFPGGCLPSRREFERHAAAAGLRVVDTLGFGADYAVTLRLWRERFLAQRHAVLALGFDERFIRLWEFYLAYCEAAFTHGNTDVVQYTLVRD